MGGLREVTEGEETADLRSHGQPDGELEECRRDDHASDRGVDTGLFARRQGGQQDDAQPDRADVEDGRDRPGAANAQNPRLVAVSCTAVSGTQTCPGLLRRHLRSASQAKRKPASEGTSQAAARVSTPGASSRTGTAISTRSTGFPICSTPTYGITVPWPWVAPSRIRVTVARGRNTANSRTRVTASPGARLGNSAVAVPGDRKSSAAAVVLARAPGTTALRSSAPTLRRR